MTKLTAIWGKYLSRGSLAVFWVLLLVGTHWPPSASSPPFNLSDKLLHFVAYSGLAFLLTWVLSIRTPPTWERAALVISICCLAGALDEITQPWTGRTTELYDWYADVAGAIAGVAVFMLLTTLERRRAKTAGTVGV